MTAHVVEADAHVVGGAHDLPLHTVSERRAGASKRPSRALGTMRRGWLVRRALLLGDVASLLVAAAVVGLAVGGWAWYFAGVGLTVLLAKLYGLYDGDEDRANPSTVDDVPGLFHVTTVNGFLLLLASALVGTSLPVMHVAAFWALSIPLLASGRATARFVSRRSVSYVQNTVILGAGDIGQLIARKILQHPEYGINLLGFIDSSPKAPRGDLGDVTILGAPEDLERLRHELDLERIIVAFSGETTEDTLELVRSLRHHPLQIDIVPRLFEAVSPSTEIHAIEGFPVMGLPTVRISRTSRWLKRATDAVVGTTLLLVLSPLLAYIALRIRLSSPGPVIFRQRRLGMNQRPFEILKFRTMHAGTDDAEHRDYIRTTMDAAASPTPNGLYKLSRADAITPFGAWLRRTSLD
jgi:hypothetical protein